MIFFSMHEFEIFLGESQIFWLFIIKFWNNNIYEKISRKESIYKIEIIKLLKKWTNLNDPSSMDNIYLGDSY
jgi:hypothetical protein